MASTIDKSAIDDYIKNEMDQFKIPGLALGIIYNGQIEYVKGYARGEKLAIEPHTPFIIGSLSKSLTAVAIMQLAEAGIIDLDQSLNTYIPWLTLGAEYDNPLTARHLLLQTSGLPLAAGLSELTTSSLITLEEEVRALEDIALANAPGVRFEYSNANYLLLGYLIEKVTNQSYAEYMQQEIVEPLQMKNTFFSQEEALENGLAKGYIKKLGFPVAVEVQYLANSLAAGFIISSAEDMLNYLSMHLKQGEFAAREVLSSQQLSELYQVGTVKEGSTDYAMGLISFDHIGADALYHDGSTQGYNSAFVFSPQEQWAVVVLTNLGSMIELSAGRIALSIADFLRGANLEPSTRLNSSIYLMALLILALLLFLILRSIIVLLQRKTLKKGWVLYLAFFIELMASLFIFILFPRGAGFPVWRLLSLYHPDLVYAFLIIGALLLFKALIRGLFILQKRFV